MNIKRPQKILFEINNIEKISDLKKYLVQKNDKIENSIIEDCYIENIELYDFDFITVRFKNCQILNSQL